jgi:CHAT domain-containing protein
MISGRGRVSRVTILSALRGFAAFAVGSCVLSTICLAQGAKGTVSSEAVQAFDEAVSRNELKQAERLALVALARSSSQPAARAWHNRIGYAALLMDNIQTAKQHYTLACKEPIGSDASIAAECKAGLAFVEAVDGSQTLAARFANEALTLVPTGNRAGLPRALAPLALSILKLKSKDAVSAQKWADTSVSSTVFEPPNSHPQLANIVAQILVKVAEVYVLKKQEREAVQAYGNAFSFLTRELQPTDVNLIERLQDISRGVSIYVENPVNLGVTSFLVSAAARVTNTDRVRSSVFNSLKDLTVAGYDDDALTLLWKWQAHVEARHTIASIEAANGLIQIGDFLFWKGKSRDAGKLFDKGLAMIASIAGKNSREYQRAEETVNIARGFQKKNDEILNDFRQQMQASIERMKRLEQCALDPNTTACGESQSPQPGKLDEPAEQFFPKSGVETQTLKSIRSELAVNRADLLKRSKKLPLTSSEELRWRRQEMDRSFFTHLRLLAGVANSNKSNVSAEIDEALGILQLRGIGRAADAVQRSAARAVVLDPSLSDEARMMDRAVIEWRTARDQLSALRIQDDNTNTIASLTETLTSSYAQVIKVNEKLTANSSTYKAAVSFDGVRLSDVRQALGAREALLVLAFNKRHGLIGMLVTKDVARLVDLGMHVSGEQIMSLMRNLRASIVDEQAAYDFVSANGLYRALIEPFRNDLDGIDHLVIVPQTDLITVPFPALVESVPTSDQKVDTITWLVSKRSITFALSPKSFVLLRSAPKQAFQDVFAGFAAPVMDPTESSCPTTAWGKSTSSCLFPPLPQTLKQVEVLAAALGANVEKSIFAGPNMTRATVNSALAHPVNIVAFATHGLLSEEMFRAAQIDQPALMLSAMPSDKSNQDRWLTASMIEGMSINSSLIVLSACNTGGGGGNGDELDQDEALSGLTRAFFESGVKGVLVTHWAIQADRTTEVLEEMASSLTHSPNKKMAEILRDGMLAQLKRTVHPRDWAMFAYVGN